MSDLVFIDEQFSLSTAEDEKNYFSGTPLQELPEVAPEKILPPGLYRVIDGEVFRIAPGSPFFS